MPSSLVQRIRIRPNALRFDSWPAFATGEPVLTRSRSRGKPVGIAALTLQSHPPGTQEFGAAGDSKAKSGRGRLWRLGRLRLDCRFAWCGLGQCGLTGWLPAPAEVRSYRAAWSFASSSLGTGRAGAARMLSMSCETGSSAGRQRLGRAGRLRIARPRHSEPLVEVGPVQPLLAMHLRDQRLPPTIGRPRCRRSPAASDRSAATRNR